MSIPTLHSQVNFDLMKASLRFKFSFAYSFACLRYSYDYLVILKAKGLCQPKLDTESVRFQPSERKSVHGSPSVFNYQAFASL